MTSCKGVIGVIFGHKFQPRYSYGNPTIENVKYVYLQGAIELIDASKSETYICDVCERCGLTTKGQS